MTEHEAYVAFNMVPNIGSVKLGMMVKKYGSAAAAWEALPDKTDWQGRPVDWAAEMSLAKRKNIEIVDCTDSRYPPSLGDLPSKPIVLYVAGNPNVLSMPGIAVVGTRLPTLYGMDMSRAFAAGIAGRGMSVISGLASGVDAAAHSGALAAGGITIAVLGGALDRFFPEENRELGRKIVASSGAVICEYPFGFPPGRKTFPQRNRIVAALARGVLAVESPIQSGTLITCGIAKKLGRVVMAVPGNLDSKHSAGCWKLIREGAVMATCVNDIVTAAEASFPDLKKSHVSAVDEKTEKVTASAVPEAQVSKPAKRRMAVKPQMSIEEAVVFKAIPSSGITLERLAFVTKLPASNVSDSTMSLRLKKLIRFLPGNRVAPCAVC